jgi:hypothetical protein
MSVLVTSRSSATRMTGAYTRKATRQGHHRRRAGRTMTCMRRVALTAMAVLATPLLACGNGEAPPAPSEVAELRGRLEAQELQVQRLRQRLSALEDRTTGAASSAERPERRIGPVLPELPESAQASRGTVPAESTAFPIASERATASALLPAASSARSKELERIATGIRRVSSTEFRLKRETVDRVLENQTELMRQTRIVPEQDQGKVVGIRMFGVRSDSLLGLLGFENGDRLETLNGMPMFTPEKALEAYARLRTARAITVMVQRRGQPLEIHWQVE